MLTFHPVWNLPPVDQETLTQTTLSCQVHTYSKSKQKIHYLKWIDFRADLISRTINFQVFTQKFHGWLIYENFARILFCSHKLSNDMKSLKACLIICVNLLNKKHCTKNEVSCGFGHIHWRNPW